jgi:hypothetical protein
MKSVFVPVLALKSPARSTSPKFMVSPTSWHMCSNMLMSAYGKPCGAAYTMHRNKGLWKALPKRSQILVPSLVVFQTTVLFAHVSLTSTAMLPLCFRTTPCVVTCLATLKQQNLGKTGNVSPGKWCVSVKATTVTCWNRSSRCSCVSSFVITTPWMFHMHTCKSLWPPPPYAAGEFTTLWLM